MKLGQDVLLQVDSSADISYCLLSFLLSLYVVLEIGESLMTLQLGAMAFISREKIAAGTLLGRFDFLAGALIGRIQLAL